MQKHPEEDSGITLGHRSVSRERDSLGKAQAENRGPICSRMCVRLEFYTKWDSFHRDTECFK